MLSTMPSEALVDTLIADAKDALRSGDATRARTLLQEATNIDPHNEHAWLWLSGAYDTPHDRRECLEHVLAINPANSTARAGIAKLGAAPAAPQSTADLQSVRADLAPAASPSVMTADPVPPRVEAMVGTAATPATPAIELPRVSADELQPAAAASAPPEAPTDGVWRVPVPTVDAAFARDRFLLRQKHLSIAAKYFVWDEHNQPLMYVERPLHLLRNIFATVAAMAVMGLLLTISWVMVLIGRSVVFAIVFGVPALMLSIAAGIVLGTMLCAKRHVTFYRDETKRERLLQIVQDKKFWLINATYTIMDADGDVLAQLRKNYLYNLLRKRWYCYSPDGSLLCTAKEDSLFRSIFRRVLSNVPYIGALSLLLRTNFVIQRYEQGELLGVFNRKLTVLDRYALDMSADTNMVLDRRIALGLGVMLDTGERR